MSRIPFPLMSVDMSLTVRCKTTSCFNSQVEGTHEFRYQRKKHAIHQKHSRNIQFSYYIFHKFISRSFEQLGCIDALQVMVLKIFQHFNNLGDKCYFLFQNCLTKNKEKVKCNILKLDTPGRGSEWSSCPELKQNITNVQIFKEKSGNQDLIAHSL